MNEQNNPWLDKSIYEEEIQNEHIGTSTQIVEGNEEIEEQLSSNLELNFVAGDISEGTNITFKRHKTNLSNKNANRFVIPSLSGIENIELEESLSPNLAKDQNFKNVNIIPSEDNFFDAIKYDETSLDGRQVVYDDFNAIDWNYDFAVERSRKNDLNKIPGFKGVLKRWYDASQAWWIVLFIGVTCGCLAAFIDIVSDWLSDIKIGYCSTAFYINQAFCCWGYKDNECSEWVPWYKLLGANSDVASYLSQYLIFLFTGTLFAVLSAILVNKYAPYASRSGLPEVKTILGGFIIRGFLGKWTLLIKTIGSCLAVASGLTLGKEGPLVHIACCVGNFFLRYFPKYKFNEAKKREILSAAASAGISVAFGTPIGGVVYSLEEVSYYFPYKIMWRSFFCAMMAAVTLRAINPFRTGNLVQFQVAYTTNWHGFEMLFFLLLGVIGGLLGALFIRLNLKLTAIYQSSFLSRFPVHLVFATALITAAISYPNIYMRVDASELLSNLFKECDTGSYPGLCEENELSLTVVLLTIAGLLKYILALITFPLDIPAGFYMPSMMIGACLGRVLGTLVHYWQRNAPDFFLFASCNGSSCVAPGTYAMVGAAAMMGGMTRMTVSLVIIMFELTGALNYALPIMMAVMTSKWVGDFFGAGGLTHGLINLFEYPYLDNKEECPHNSTAGNIMTRIEDLVTIPANGPTIESLNELLAYSNFKGFPVIKSTTDTMLIGYISRSELRTAIELGIQQLGIDNNSSCLFDIVDAYSLSIMESGNFLDFRSWTDHTPITVTLSQPMELVISLFCNMGLRYVLVTKYGKLVGLISKKDVLRHLSFVNSNQNSSFSNDNDMIPLINRNPNFNE